MLYVSEIQGPLATHGYCLLKQPLCFPTLPAAAPINLLLFKILAICPSYSPLCPFTPIIMLNSYSPIKISFMNVSNESSPFFLYSSKDCNTQKTIRPKDICSHTTLAGTHSPHNKSYVKGQKHSGKYFWFTAGRPTRGRRFHFSWQNHTGVTTGHGAPGERQRLNMGRVTASPWPIHLSKTYKITMSVVLYHPWHLIGAY